jgi:transposase-like protein
MDKAIDGKEANMVHYILPSTQGVLKLERRCPHCGRNNGRVHSGVHQRRISDPKLQAVPQRRMKCPWCGTTWTLRDTGVLPGHHRTRRLEALGVILYMLGLSYRSVEQFLPLLDCVGSKSSIERDVTAAGERAGDLHRQSPGLRVRVLGVDGTGAAMAGRDAGLLFLVAVSDGGRLIGVEPLREEQTARLRSHVAKVFAEVGAQELRTDEHSAYEGIVPEERHRLCLTHWRKSKGKRASDLHRQAVSEGAVLEAQTTEELLALLRKKPRAPTVPEELDRLVRRYINAHRGLPGKVNQLLQHVERTWEKVSDDPVDPTNNVTERMIGLTFKIRAKTTRGFKAMHKVLAHPLLAFYLRGQDGVCDLRKVL